MSSKNEKSNEINFLNDVLYGEDGLFLRYYLHFNKERKKVIESLANSEYSINY